MRKENVRLRELRLAAGKRQRECAEALGVTQPSYARRESGETPLRRRDKVALALLFGLSVDEAFPGDASARRAA